MLVRPLRLDDEAELRRAHQIGYRGDMEDGRPWNNVWTFEEMAVALRQQTPGQRHEMLGIFDGDRMVGAGVVWCSLEDNLDKAMVIPVVEPELRRRGIGGELLEGLVEYVRGLGRTEIMSGTSVAFEERDTAPVLRFAKAHGFTPANTEVVRMLSLPLPEALLDEIDAEGAAYAEGYEVRSYVGEVPEELLASYCHLLNQLVVDSPTGEMDFEPEQVTPDAVRHDVERDRAVGRMVFRSFAVRDGEAVAHSDLVVRPAGHRASQWGTLVRADHRGHRLGAAVKVANLRALQKHRPEVTEVVTQNSEVNAQMIGINERLGFRAVALVPEFLRRDAG
ncbi:MAG: GNAT family N-acetyltransferase [Nocardioidaceae bacterium]|nr:GNAT family N-acetyltransferase [Nocardioidaceae bacterium]NUS50696.1 GNAT family N-acetyltransferase [Nocardioidaceae bacterium]